MYLTIDLYKTILGVIVESMGTIAPVCGKRYNRATSALQLFFAALYAFVLPFICAGAQATPGHPHARAHFVFLEPELVDHSDHTRAMVHMKDEMNDEMGSMAMAHDLPTAEQAEACLLRPTHAGESQLPAGRSVPMQLVTSGLLLLGSSAALVPPLADTVGFSVWLANSIVAPFHARVPTPPPR